MGEAIFFIVFIIPAILGVAELIHLLRVYIICPKINSTSYLIIFLGESSPCKQLAFAAEELSWRGKKYAQNIIAVDCGLNAEEYQICYSFCEKNNFIFCNTKELQGYIDVITGKI